MPNNNQNQNRRRFTVSTPCPRPNGKTWWREVGNAVENKDGSINIYLDAFPINGQLHLRDAEERQQDERGNQRRGRQDQDDNGWENNQPPNQHNSGRGRA